MSLSKKTVPERDSAAGVYLSETPSPPRFLFGVVKQFLGSESGQIQSVKLVQNMISNTTQHPPPPSSHTLSILYFDFGRGGGGEEMNQREG
jgi:hypothetical protein